MQASVLWRQTLNPPRIVRLTRIFETVVQAVVTALPELNCLRGHSVTSPKGWQRNLSAAELLFQVFPLHLENLARGNNATLPRCPRRELAATGLGDEVFERFGN